MRPLVGRMMEKVMLDHNALVKVAAQAGLASSNIDMWGDEAQVSDETLQALLSALDYDVSSEEALFKSAQKAQKGDVIAPVLVLEQHAPLNITLNLGASARLSDFQWRIETEQGESFEGYLQSQVVTDDRVENEQVTFSIPCSLSMGYHTLWITRKRRKTPYKTTLIMTPKACYKPPQLEQGKKLWGPSVQLYTLRTPHNWGIGDFGDLKQLVSEIASRGGDFVGLNPIHALFPANPEAASPYSPSSRRWLNILYLDVSSIAEFSLCAEAQQIVGSADFQQRLQQVRDTHWVSYSEVAKLKMEILPLLFNEFKVRHLESASERGRAFLEFIEHGGESLAAQATFDALHVKLHSDDDSVWGWQVFPDAYRHFNHTAVTEFRNTHRDDVMLYMYLQWVADIQIQEVQDLAIDKGMAIGLYRDLAVGVADSGSEVWADDGTLLTQIGIGAPPDMLGPQGQNWGLPPLNPQVLTRNAYQPFIDLLRANMKHCGALRIDHVLGLLRLWWIPKGQDASTGTYMRYPVADLLAILALESHRHHCSVIGEDLGTVPEEITELLAEAGVHSYKVFFFETAKDGGFISPEHYVAQSMSALCTHDMPTLRGFWHCDDLKMGRDIGIYSDAEQLKVLFDGRLAAKQRILESVAWHGYLPEGIGRDASLVPMDFHLSEALQLHVAAGSSALLSLQLEDWLEMDKPVNIPGTVDQYPNWRRKLSTSLDDLFAREEINRLMARVTAVRRGLK
jgi:4-alpha-glucanotransferase